MNNNKIAYYRRRKEASILEEDPSTCSTFDFASKCFVLLGISMLMCLATYLTYQSYKAWHEKPFQIVNSGSVPLSKIPFPAIVFCNDGTSKRFLLASIVRTLQTIHKEFKGVKFKYSPPYETAMKMMADSEKNFPLEFDLYTSRLPENVTQFFEKNLKIFGSASILFIKGLWPRLSYDFLSKFLKTDVEKVTEKIASTSSPPLETFDSYLDTNYNHSSKNISKISFETSFQKLFPFLLAHLWNGKLPCFALEETTFENSFVRRCKWKGKLISCSAIFDTTFTDAGVCCSFNFAAANDLYASTINAEAVADLQTSDKKNSLQNSDKPNWYIGENGEPVARAGSNLGLQVVLDARNDIKDKLSIASDFSALSMLITNPVSFPSIRTNGFKIRTGTHNSITVSGTVIRTDDALTGVSPEMRGCVYPDEIKLNLFKHYTLENCLEECNLKIVQSHVMRSRQLNSSCTPWYLPMSSVDDTICSPDLQKDFQDSLMTNVAKHLCSHCQPPCNNVIYKHHISLERLRHCDDFNFNAAPLCTIKTEDEVIKHINETFANKILFIGNRFRQVSRIGHTIGEIFESTFEPYNSFDRDIAMVSVYFDSPRVGQFLRVPSSSWILFWSNVGKFYGFCVGISVATICEIIWLCKDFIR